MSNATIEPTRSQTRQLPLRVDESRMTTTYANAIRTSPTSDELVLDFGISLPRTDAGRPAGPVMTIDSRVVVNWANAKRMAIALSQLVQAFEQQNGVITLATPATAPATNS